MDLYKYTPAAAEKFKADPVPHYSVCGHKWHGLTVIDYAFLAEVWRGDQAKPNPALCFLFSISILCGTGDDSSPLTI